MSKFFKVLSCLLAVIFMSTACSSSASEKVSQEDLPIEERTVDIDLTLLSSTMLYSEVYRMVFYPEDYRGKVIKMAGDFNVYENFITGENYYAAVIEDATACCQQGVEFILKEGTYPQDYPELQEEIVVVGEFQTYEEFNNTFFHLIDAFMI